MGLLDPSSPRRRSASAAAAFANLGHLSHLPFGPGSTYFCFCPRVGAAIRCNPRSHFALRPDRTLGYCLATRKPLRFASKCSAITQLNLALE
jgi:hypothetical protein